MQGQIFKELQRRHVFKSAGIYAVAAWVIMQVAEIVTPALYLPEWTTTLVIFLLALGFPITTFNIKLSIHRLLQQYPIQRHHNISIFIGWCIIFTTEC